MNFKNGDVVALKQPIIKGVVVMAAYDSTCGETSALVESTDEDGVVSQRWIKFDQLELAGE